MRRKNLFKTLFILLVIGWSVVVLYPSFHVTQLENRAEEHYKKIEENTSLTRNEVKAALSSANLQLQVRNRFKGSDGTSLEGIVNSDVLPLIELDAKIKKEEPQAIRLGLDLQGGTYLVYEVDLPQLMQNLAKVKDEAFETTIRKTLTRTQTTNEDFFDALTEVFAEDNLRLNRYFGGSRDSDEKIIEDLKVEAEDAVNRTLEVLRNRIDQFGVSEPSITKQGSQRIVIELAGIQDVDRAKRIIGTTALLEFQLEAEPEKGTAVRNAINRVWKRRIEKQDGLTADSTTSDTTSQQKMREDTEVSLRDVFGETAIKEDRPETSQTDTAGTDSTVLIDEEIFQDRPFDALLANIGGDIAVPTKNRLAVENILNSPEAQSVIPKDIEFVFSNRSQRVGDQEYYMLYILKKEPELLGAMISDARPNIGSEMQAGRWIVNMELTAEGARLFSRVTGANINKRLAIVLDGRIVSIPNIQEKIPSGRAQITGMANDVEAKDLAIQLRAGALPAPVEVIEERTVGPSLGQDSINKGTYSAMVGMLFVIGFMVLYYRLSGLVANLALILNLIILMAVLAGFHATLTLPGVAGIILTIGMAVDANVLIFERIREELRGGKTIRAAIDSGYSRAFRTILDANVTTLLTAVVLYQFGTGPIRGFALTLSIGIVVSMFTAIMVTRVVFDYVTDKFAISKLSI
jgi:preprotein translocase subunit SecD